MRVGSSPEDAPHRGVAAATSTGETQAPNPAGRSAPRTQARRRRKSRAEKKADKIAAAEAAEAARPKATLDVVGLDEPVVVNRDVNLMRACKEQHVNLFWGPWAKLFYCRGRGSCFLCKVEVIDASESLPERNDKESRRLRGKPDSWRLACQITATESMRIEPFPWIPIEDRVTPEALTEARRTRAEDRTESAAAAQGSGASASSRVAPTTGPTSDAEVAPEEPVADDAVPADPAPSEPASSAPGPSFRDRLKRGGAEAPEASPDAVVPRDGAAATAPGPSASRPEPPVPEDPKERKKEEKRRAKQQKKAEREARQAAKAATRVAAKADKKSGKGKKGKAASQTGDAGGDASSSDPGDGS